MAGTGGARPGSGRKPRTTKNETAITAAERQIRDRLPEIVDNLLYLADGGYEQVEEEWQPAGMVYVGEGEDRRKAFPQKPPDELVLVKRKVSTAAKDRAANIYLVDRIMGKPTQKNQITGADDGPIQVTNTPFNYAHALSDIAPPDASV